MAHFLNILSKLVFKKSEIFGKMDVDFSDLMGFLLYFLVIGGSFYTHKFEKKK